MEYSHATHSYFFSISSRPNSKKDISACSLQRIIQGIESISGNAPGPSPPIFFPQTWILFLSSKIDWPSSHQAIDVLYAHSHVLEATSLLSSQAGRTLQILPWRTSSPKLLTSSFLLYHLLPLYRARTYLAVSRFRALIICQRLIS
jgi:hypothetical protein